MDAKALEAAFPNSKVFILNVLKQSNLACGIGTHSSRYPLHSNLWSKWSEYSDPATLRTGSSLSADLQRRKDAARKGEDESAKFFHSVERKPISILRERPEVPIGDTLCPCPLHLNPGVAPHVVEYVEKLDPDICVEWEHDIEVKREEKRDGKRTYNGLYLFPC